jgi:hypothetical protein
VSAYQTLMTQLAAAPTMTGIAVQFGEESIADESQPLPRVVLVPLGGEVGEPAYSMSTDPDVENQWSITEQCDVYMFAWSNAVDATPADHANAVELLRQKVLSAFQWQRYNENATTGATTGGLYWKPLRMRWARFGDAVLKYGRCCVLTVEVEIPMVDQSFEYQDATILTVTQNAAVSSP